MLECNYGHEIYDRKLNAILFLRKLWLIIVAAGIGALLAGSVYYIKFILFAPEPEYRTYSMLYVDFVEGEDGPQYYTFNAAGWAGFVKTDVILDYALAYREEAGEEVNLFTKEELRQSVSAGTDADYRIVDLYVTHKDPAIALEMAQAMEQGFVKFADDMRECEQIRVMTKAVSADRILIDDNTPRVVFWGAMIAGALVWMSIAIALRLDDSVYFKDQFEKRYKIAVTGSIMKHKKNKTPYPDIEFFDFDCFASRPEIVFAVGEGNKTELEQTENNLESLFELHGVEHSFIKVINIVKSPESLETLNETEVFLLIPCGARNGRRIEKMIHQVHRNQIKIAGVVLTDVDAILLHQYYFNLFGKRSEL